MHIKNDASAPTGSACPNKASATVTPIKRKGSGGPPSAGAHIDSASYALLVETLVGFLELRIAEGDAGRHCAELERLTRQLESLASRFTSPKGAA